MNKFIFFSRKDAEAQREDLLNHVREASRRDRSEGHEGRKEEEKRRRREEEKGNFYVVGNAHLTSYSVSATRVTRPLEL